MGRVANPLQKAMTKKSWRKICASRRGMSGFNTGTRTYRSAKDYSRRYAISDDMLEGGEQL